MNNSTVITTPVARFSAAHLAKQFETGRFPQEAWARGMAKSYPEHRVELYGLVDKRLDLVFSSGPQGIKPRIWTHTPVPYGMNIEAVHKQFEERAASILSDYETPVNFEPDPAYTDGRYRDIPLRSAWMMYLDLAIERHLAGVCH